MGYNIDILISANADYVNICENLLEYGAYQINNFKDSFSKFLDNVSNMPYMYPQYNSKQKYRKATLAYDYFAFYQIDKKTRTVIISRILNSRQNIENLLYKKE